MNLAQQFDKAIAEIQDKVLEGAVKPIVKDVAEQAVLWTPVDTGNARFSWLASLDSPVYIPLEYSGDDGAMNRVYAPNPSEASNKAIAFMNTKIDEMTVDTKAVYITNSVEYILDLNDKGKSKQSKQFAQRAVEMGADRAVAVIEAKGQLNAFN
jgi:hypothetical protein